VIAASAAFAALATIFGSPSSPSLLDFIWTIVVSMVAAVVVLGIVRPAKAPAGFVDARPWVLIPGVGVTIAVLAIVFSQITDQSADVVLFSGETAFDGLFSQAATLSIGTVVLLLVFKSAAWSLSLGSFRGGPTFPALFVGAVGSLLAANLPGYSETPAVAALMAASAVAMLRLPLSSVVITMLLTAGSRVATAPIIIVAAVVAYITLETLDVKTSPAASSPA
jgi:hypothetical protein